MASSIRRKYAIFVFFHIFLCQIQILWQWSLCTVWRETQPSWSVFLAHGRLSSGGRCSAQRANKVTVTCTKTERWVRFLLHWQTSAGAFWKVERSHRWGWCLFVSITDVFSFFPLFRAKLSNYLLIWGKHCFVLPHCFNILVFTVAAIILTCCKLNSPLIIYVKETPATAVASGKPSWCLRETAVKASCV